MSTSPRSPLALAALATVAIPGLNVVATRPPRHPDADFDVAALMDSTGRRWTVRAPRGAAAGAALEGEVDVLAGLAVAVDEDALPFDVARPAGFAPLPEGGRAMVHRELPGEPLQVARLSPQLARTLGQTLARIHDLDPAVVADAGLPVYTAEAYRRRRLAELDEAAGTGHVPPGLLRRWEQALEDVRLWRFITTPVHGDMAAEHILIADAEITAIVNWGDARVADPADDLAWLLAAAEPQAGETILQAYTTARAGRADDYVAARTLLASELALSRWLMHGVRIRDNGVIDDAIAMLTDLDQAVAGADAIGHVPPVSTDWVTGPVPVVTGPMMMAGDGEPGQVHDGEPGQVHDGESVLVQEQTGQVHDDEPDRAVEPTGSTVALGGAEHRVPAGMDDPTLEGVIAVGPDPQGSDLHEPDYDRSGGGDRGDDSPTTRLPSA